MTTDTLDGNASPVTALELELELELMLLEEELDELMLELLLPPPMTVPALLPDPPLHAVNNNAAITQALCRVIA